MRIAIIGSGLKIGAITYVGTSETVIKMMNLEGVEVDTVVQVSIGEVVKQQPAVGQTVERKSLVNLWIYQPDSLAAMTPTDGY